MSIATISVLMDELSGAARRLEHRASQSDAFLITDRIDRISRLGARLPPGEDAADVQELLDGLQSLASLCRSELQDALQDANALAAFHTAFDTQIRSHPATPEDDPSDVVVLADDLFRLTAACGWLRGTAREHAVEAVQYATSCIEMFPDAFLAMTGLATLRMGELLGPESLDGEASDPTGSPPALLWTVLELCSGLPLLELADRVEAGETEVRGRTEGVEPEPAPVIPLRPQSTRRRIGTVGELVAAADDGIESWTDTDAWRPIAARGGWHLQAQVRSIAAGTEHQIWVMVVFDDPRPDLTRLKEQLEVRTLSGEPVPIRVRTEADDTLLVQVVCASPFVVLLPAANLAGMVDPEVLFGAF